MINQNIFKIYITISLHFSKVFQKLYSTEYNGGKNLVVEKYFQSISTKDFL